MQIKAEGKLWKAHLKRSPLSRFIRLAKKDNFYFTKAKGSLSKKTCGSSMPIRNGRPLFANLRDDKGKKSITSYRIIKNSISSQISNSFITLYYSFGKRCLRHYKIHQHLRCSIYVHRSQKNVPNFRKK